MTQLTKKLTVWELIISELEIDSYLMPNEQFFSNIYYHGDNNLHSMR
jgi:hypothetical protein